MINTQLKHMLILFKITFLLLLTALLLFSCGGIDDTDKAFGTITLNFGGASASQNARAALPDDVMAELTHTVQLKGAATVMGTTEMGEQRLSVSAPAGIYTLTVTAIRNGKEFAEGTANNVKIEAGKTTSVTVQMTLADSGNGGVIIIPFTGDSLDAFKAWLDAMPTNTPETAYNAALNVTSLGTGTRIHPYNQNLTTSQLAVILVENKNKYVNLNLSGSNLISIEERDFYFCDTLTSIDIPLSVKSIGNSAFTSCTWLTSIILPYGVTSIGESAFQSCQNLPSITIPIDAISIGVNAFIGCRALTSVTFAGSSVSDNGFSNNAFPEGPAGNGGNNLKNAYLSTSPNPGGIGTYTRDPGGTTWIKN